MGISTLPPLFQLSGFGPLGLPTQPSAYSLPSLAAMMPASPSRASSAFREAAGPADRSSGTYSAPAAVRLMAASEGDGARGVSGPAGSAAASHVLRWITGGNTGKAISLPPAGEFILGHGEGCDVVLPREGTGRRHAKILRAGDAYFVEDLGSTSGTSINGKKIAKRTALNEGDRLLIGGTIFKFEKREANAKAGVTESSGTHTLPPPSPRAEPMKRMSGQLETIPLPDLLQLLAGSQKTGVLRLDSPHGTGRIFLRQGRAFSCTMDGHPDASPRKLVFRMLRWTEGTFNLEPPDDAAAGQEMNDSIDSILMNGMCEMDEINRLDLGGIDPGAHLSVDLKSGRLRDLSPDELDVVQSLLSHPGSLEAFLDRFPGSDLQALAGLLPLIKKGFVVSK